MLSVQGCSQFVYGGMGGGFFAPAPTTTDGAVMPSPVAQLCFQLYAMPGSDEAAVKHLLNLFPQELAAVACDAQGSRYLQQSLASSRDLRIRLLQVLLDNKHLVPVATDAFGNFVVQRMLSEPEAGTLIADALLANGLQLSLNRYSCRVIQKLVAKAPLERVLRLFEAYRGSEGVVAKDVNANHVVQKIMECHVPDVYASYIKAVAAEPGIIPLMQDKYGCRVVQMCLEKVVAHCFSPHVSEANKRTAFEVLSLMITPILEHARSLAENEYANYIVQYVLRSPHLELQRQFIISNHILHNILWLSQGKFSSHVVEQALCYANAVQLRAMFDEVLTGYEVDSRGRDALDILLFDQFGNYVVQRLFKVAVDVCSGRREGNATWLSEIAVRVLRSESSLRRYSSGKKLLCMLADLSNQGGLIPSTSAAAVATPSTCYLVPFTGSIPATAAASCPYTTTAMMVAQPQQAPPPQFAVPAAQSMLMSRGGPVMMPTQLLSMDGGWATTSMPPFSCQQVMSM